MTPAGNDLPPVSYLTFDSVAEGVGASQVLPYVERLARRGVPMTLHSFEKGRPSPGLADRLAAAGVDWRPRRFGAHGTAGGLARIALGAAAIRGAQLVHARSDLAAASALLAHPPAWIWDMRSFWVDQRISLGLVRSGSAAERLLRVIERRAALSAAAVVTLADAAVDVLEERHGPRIRGRTHTIPTCVDLDRFPLTPMPPADTQLRLVLSGTLNRLYDVPSSIGLAETLGRRRPVTLVALTPGPGPWDAALAKGGAHIEHAIPTEVPRCLGSGHVGLCLLSDGGIGLRAAMPTKVAEFLAIGRPVVVSAGIGDLDRRIGDSGAGVILAGMADSDLESAADQIEELVADPETSNRCRGLATASFDVERGVDRLIEIYRQLSEQL